MSVFPVFNRLKQCRHGQMLYNPNDIYIGRSFDLYGEFSEEENLLFREYVRPGQFVVEVGANIGAHTVSLAQLVGPQGFVVAFEPQQIAFQTLCANVALNSITNVSCLQVVVGAQPGSMKVPMINPLKEENYGGLTLGNYSEGQDTLVVSLDRLNLPACHFLKVDVEGMEEDVLRGGRETIARYRPILYVENDRGGKSPPLSRYIASLGYRMFWHFPRLFSPGNFLGNRQNVFGETVSLNLLCLHRDAPLPAPAKAIELHAE